jgi:hypothetical protein
MKRGIVVALSMLLLMAGLAGCGYASTPGSGSGASATSKPGY